MIDKCKLSEMLLSVADLFYSQKDALSEIDSRFGDGDHGITIGKIALLIRERVAGWGDETIKEFISNLGDAVMGVNGGSAGPLYGTLIGGLAVPLAEETQVDAAMLKRMLVGCREEMFEISTARVGDKTMMDALIPAVEAGERAPQDIPQILVAAAAAAQAGAKKSEEFISKFGRARSYKEQTIGTQDAGACSTALFFEGLAKPFKY